jgi:hypothetical protein
MTPLGININLYLLGFYFPFSHVLYHFYCLFMIHYPSPILTYIFTSLYAFWVSFFSFFGSCFKVLGRSTPPCRPYQSADLSSALPYNALGSTAVLYTLETRSTSLCFGGFFPFSAKIFFSLVCGSLYPVFVDG